MVKGGCKLELQSFLNLGFRTDHSPQPPISQIAFSYCSDLVISDLVKGKVEEIGRDAFEECMSLHEIMIPPSVKRIEDWAYHKCRNLRIVHLGEGVEEIGASAFRCCRQLAIVHLGNCRGL